MTREEAHAQADILNRERPMDGPWGAQRQAGDEWSVVRLVVPGLQRTAPTGAHVESKPKPPEPSDPRPAIFQNVPPYGAA
jgi:hypothetical protein